MFLLEMNPWCPLSKLPLMLLGHGLMRQMDQKRSSMHAPLSTLVQTHLKSNKPLRATQPEKSQFKCRKTPGFLDTQNRCKSSVIKDQSAATLILEVSSSAKESKEFHAQLKIHNQMQFQNQSMMLSKHLFAMLTQPMRTKQTAQSIGLLCPLKTQSKLSFTKPVVCLWKAWFFNKTCSCPSPLWQICSASEKRDKP